MTEKLKPCPFCGAIPDIKRLHLSNHKISFSIVCFNTNCFVKPMSEWFNTEEKAIEAWNRRANNEGKTD